MLASVKLGETFPLNEALRPLTEMARLQRGLAIGEIGILGLSLHGSNPKPLMSALGQKRTLIRIIRSPRRRGRAMSVGP